MSATSQTLSYTTPVALALDKLHPVIADAISTGNKGLYFIKKKGNFKGVESGGPQLRVPIMYQLQTLRPLGAYGSVNINPVNGDTAAYFAWGQTAAHITFSDLEDFQMRGMESLESIVDAKRRQAEASLDDIFTRSFFRGQAEVDATSFASPLLGDASATFIDPIGKLIHGAPTSSATIGGIDQSANSWWQNQLFDSAAATLAAWLDELRTLYVRCGFGGGGANAYPDFHLVDPTTYVRYEKALALTHRNPDYGKGDIPFENVAFKAKPVVPEELVGDIKNASTTVTDGTWYMCNSEYMGFSYDKKDSFRVGKSIRPAGQLVESALMPVRGAFWVNNRRKLGVMIDIDLATLNTATS